MLNKAGNITIKNTEHGNYNYGYDKAYRLKSAINPTLDNESYTYDKVGNRLSSANTTGNWSYDNNDQLLSTPTDAYEYTTNGNTKKITPNDTTQKVTDYIYDSRERLTEVKKDNTTIQNNRYDFQQRRVVKTTVSGTTYFLYGQSGLIAEYEIDGDFIQGYGYFPKASYTTNPVYTITPKTGTGYAFDFYHNDHLATPQKLTDSTGAVSWAMQSNAFGEVTIKTQTTKNNLCFPGQYYDTEIKLSQNYFRDYAPSLGRYVQSDPIGLISGINSYIYANSSPTIGIDYFGLATTCTSKIKKDRWKANYLETKLHLDSVGTDATITRTCSWRRKYYEVWFVDTIKVTTCTTCSKSFRDQCMGNIYTPHDCKTTTSEEYIDSKKELIFLKSETVEFNFEGTSTLYKKCCPHPITKQNICINTDQGNHNY